jgi:hypothetical protein
LDGGGDRRDRTDDLKLAKLPLSQLSYVPQTLDQLVGLGGLEPPTSRLSSARSNQLSYKPDLCLRMVPHIQERRETKTAASRQYAALNAAFVLKRFDEKPEGFKQRVFLRKEVIQPQVPLRLPCYDFTPVADPTVVACLLAVSITPSGRTNSHGVTGGVYKARERIHRGILIRDY